MVREMGGVVIDLPSRFAQRDGLELAGHGRLFERDWDRPSDYFRGKAVDGARQSLNRTPWCGHQDLREAWSTAGRFGCMRRTGNRPAVGNALTAMLPARNSEPALASVARSASTPRQVRHSQHGA